MENQKNTGKVIGALLLGVAAGGAIGATLGLLLAPAKGSETRKKLFSKGDKLSDAVKEKFTEFVTEIRKEVASGKEKSAELVDNGSSKIERSK